MRNIIGDWRSTLGALMAENYKMESPIGYIVISHQMGIGLIILNGSHVDFFL